MFGGWNESSPANTGWMSGTRWLPRGRRRGLRILAKIGLPRDGRVRDAAARAALAASLDVRPHGGTVWEATGTIEVRYRRSFQDAGVIVVEMKRSRRSLFLWRGPS